VYLSIVVPLGVFAQEPVVPDDPPRVVIPFDFESRFDDGRYGRMIGDMIWTKLRRQGGFILPESMQDVRDWCQRNRMLPNPETSLPEMKEAVQAGQAGDLAIWGKVERAAGTETDAYDLWINVADFSADPVRMLYSRQVRTRTVSEIPHLYIKEALEHLSGRTPAPAEPQPKDRPATGAVLVAGDFEQGRGSPRGWSALAPGVAWVEEEANERPNHVVRFTLSEEVAGTTGVLYYSDFFPVQEGATYRVECRWRTTGPAAKVFIKCYDEFSTAYGPESARGPEGERREVYRSQQNLQGQPGRWNRHSEEFTPSHPRFTPRWGRVMLYAYWPAGTVDWDDVVVRQVTPSPNPVKERAGPRVPGARAQPGPSRVRTGGRESAGAGPHRESDRPTRFPGAAVAGLARPPPGGGRPRSGRVSVL
jgi:hypothetical protein